MKKLGIIGLLGIFFVFLLQGGTAILNPAVTGIAQGLAMEPTTVAWIGTIPALFSVLSSFLVGRFAGTKIRYKTALVGSLMISVIGGSLPLVIPTWPVILFSRACIGWGVGVFFAIPPVLIMKFYEGDKQRNNMGIANAFASAGGWIGQVAAGILVGIQWNFVFGVNFLGLFGLIMIAAGMPEPEALPQTNESSKEKATVSVQVILNSILCLFAFMLFVPALVMISLVITGRGFGTFAQTGLVAGMFNISATVLSLFFGILYKVFKKFLAVIIIGVVAAGMGILYLSQSLFTAGAGMFMTGTVLLLLPTLIMDNSKFVTPVSVTLTTSLVVIASSLGNFLAGPFIQIASSIGKDMSIPSLLFGAAGLGILAVVYLIIRIFSKTPMNAPA